MIAALRVADGAVIVVCASSGVEVGTEKAWAYAEQYNTPRIIFVNKMERENANFKTAVEQLRSMFGTKVVPVQLPIGNAQDFRGHVDLIQQKAYLWDQNKVTIGDVPADMADDMAAAREALIEAVSVTDDELMMKYLEGEALTDAEIESALAVGPSPRGSACVLRFSHHQRGHRGVVELLRSMPAQPCGDSGCRH